MRTFPQGAVGVLPDGERGRAHSDDGVQHALAWGGGPALAVRRPAGRLRTVWANPAAIELVGVEPGEDLEPELVDDYLSPPDRPHWLQVLTRIIDAAENGPAVGMADGAEWHGASLATPDLVRSAVQIRVAEVSRGLYAVWLRSASEPGLLAEQAQREAEHRFAALAESAPIGIVVSEAGTRLGFVNQCFADIVGVERVALLGTRWLKSVSPEDVPTLLHTLEQVLAGEPAETTVHLVSTTDSTRLVQVRLSPVVTPRRAAGFIGTVEDVTARHAWEAQLTYQATHDALTGLINRRHLMEIMSARLSSRRSRDADAAVLFCDLDRFKQINDTLGHDAGDRVLIEVGRRLSATARDHDVVARIAGDEFVVLLTGIAGYPDAERAARRQIEALAAPVRLGGRSLSLSISVGIAMAADFSSAHAILRAADQGMYEAKRSAPGSFQQARPTTPTSSERGRS